VLPLGTQRKGFRVMRPRRGDVAPGDHAARDPPLRIVAQHLAKMTSCWLATWPLGLASAITLASHGTRSLRIHNLWWG
jgi:hypothetical protein